MLFFASDYTEGAHPKVLEHLTARNLVSLPGYGLDPDTEAAKARICAECGRDDLQICFLTGGTQTNRIAISSTLRSYEGVVCADSGHVAVHESGAIEHSGHKVIPLPGDAGKLRAEVLAACMEAYLADETCEHMVRPGMVYISHPTEFGTLYSKKELTALAETCRRYALPLYLDGARLGYGLMSPESDMTLRDICGAHRSFLHRRHQGGRPLRRGAGLYQREHAAPFHGDHQAAGRASRQDAGGEPAV